ncbi:hypothetical protein ONE63_007228 [Megalurothrips usitatus]|uniref:Ig-like domain-containing protein n=1 Tax=Megalurothrips usitatus TaxID=439358 RepID=A0AAV7XRE1_9NEOP|nr:hypothetical protein ONE63_007228 [Megalurothrips usitatus]
MFCLSVAVVVSGSDAVEGKSARLPCDLTPPLSGDQVWLVIWYREGSSQPCYSYDARSRTDNKSGTHWSDEKAFGGQVTFRENENPAHLVIENVRESDAGAYRCRVDFARSPTRNARVNLTVIIPPESLQIVDHNGTEMRGGVLGPYEEGASVNVTCISYGGYPAPRVTWWQENALLDDTSERLGDGRVRNTMNVVIERRTMGAVYTCQAANNNLESPVSTEVSFDLARKYRPATLPVQGSSSSSGRGCVHLSGETSSLNTALSDFLHVFSEF